MAKRRLVGMCISTGPAEGVSSRWNWSEGSGPPTVGANWFRFPDPLAMRSSPGTPQALP